MTNRVGQGIFIEGVARASEDIKYADLMYRQLKERRPEKRVVPTHFNGKPLSELTEAEKEEFYFSLQPESTKRAILAQKSRRPEEDWDHLTRPLPNCLANPEAKTLDGIVSKRALDPADVHLHNSAKSHRNKLGESKAGSVSGEKRDKGIQAFTYSKPASLTPDELKHVKDLKPLENAAPAIETKEEPKRKTFWQWLFGKSDAPEKKFKTTVNFKGNNLVIRTEEHEE